MRLLIDECVDPRVKQLFGGHTVATVHDRRRDALEDGPLLTIAQKEFDVLLTIDGSLEHQQNLSKYQIAVVVVHVPKNQLPNYRVVQKDLRLAEEKARPLKLSMYGLRRSDDPVLGKGRPLRIPLASPEASLRIPAS